MNIGKEVMLLKRRFPDRDLIGYWLRGDNVIINTRLKESSEMLSESAQFMVNSRGDIFGVNPVLYDLSMTNMIPLQKR